MDNPSLLKKRTTLIIVIVVLVFSFTSLSRIFFSGISKNVIKPLEHNFQEERINLTDNKTLKDEACDLLVHKVDIIENKKVHHKYIFMSLYRNYYAVVTVFPFLSGILVLLTFLILQRGWSNVNDLYTKPLFFTFSLLTAIYGLFPTIYKQEEMIEKNINNYLALDQLQKQIFHYAQTHKKLYDTIYKTDLDFINHINKNEQKLNDILYEMEHKGVDKELFKNLQ